MVKSSPPADRAKPKAVAESIAARKGVDHAKLDHAKLVRANHRAVQAADRLLKEMDDVLRNLQRKG